MILRRLALFAWLVACALLAGAATASDSASVAVSATVLSKSNCKLTTATLSIPFGTMDAALAADRVMTATVTFRCLGSAPIASFLFSSNDGLYRSGPGQPRMRHASVTTEFLPYSLGLSPPTGSIAKGSLGTLTITGTVTSANLANAIAGSFADTVTITLSP